MLKIIARYAIVLVLMNVFESATLNKLDNSKGMCISKECFLDSKRLITASNQTVSPCLDFRAFSAIF